MARKMTNALGQFEAKEEIEDDLTPVQRSIERAKSIKSDTVESRSKRTTFLLELDLKDRIDAITKVSSATKQQIINDAIREVLPEWEKEFRINQDK